MEGDGKRSHQTGTADGVTRQGQQTESPDRDSKRSRRTHYDRTSILPSLGCGDPLAVRRVATASLALPVAPRARTVERATRERSAGSVVPGVVAELWVPPLEEGVSALLCLVSHVC